MRDSTFLVCNIFKFRFIGLSHECKITAYPEMDV